ncbi:50S ribosomal protein L9 [Candidatus Sumerlaeota bacterium]|nr:50S ribosomal protein L9 [Candidatus Sumerlaeota bacterium]
MEVILLENIPKLGKAGTITQVSEGYFRNYLKPKKLALEATEKNKQLLERRRLRLQRVALKELQDAELLAQRIESMTLVARLKAGEDDRLFGSVTAGDISELLKKEGIEIDKKRIEITESLNKLGLYTVYLHLHPEVKAKLKLLIEKEQ